MVCVQNGLVPAKLAKQREGAPELLQADINCLHSYKVRNACKAAGGLRTSWWGSWA